jgi:hypothetical protein
MDTNGYETDLRTFAPTFLSGYTGVTAMTTRNHAPTALLEKRSRERPEKSPYADEIDRIA